MKKLLIITLLAISTVPSTFGFAHEALQAGLRVAMHLHAIAGIVIGTVVASPIAYKLGKKRQQQQKDNTTNSASPEKTGLKAEQIERKNTPPAPARPQPAFPEHRWFTSK